MRELVVQYLKGIEQRPPESLSDMVHPQAASTYGSKSNGSGCETNETTIASLRLMDGIGKVLTELINDFPDLVVIFVGASFSDKSFKSSDGQASNDQKGMSVSYSRAPCFRLS